MEGGRLPDAGRLRAMLAGVSIASTLLTLGLLVVYLPHVIDLTDAHVAFLGRAALPICLGILILPLVVHQRRARPLFFALKRHADADATPQDWRTAFACAVDLPRFAFVSTLLYYPLGGAGVAVALYSHDPAVGLTAPSMIAASALVAGFLAQSVAFVTLKFVLEPTRHRLASAIPDATERGNLVRPISLATKLFVSVAGLTLVTAFFTLSLSAGRAADAIEEFIVDIQRPLLLRIGRSIDAGEDPYRLIPRVRETFAPLGLELVVLEPGALASEVDPSGRLDDFELRFVRQTMERTGGDGTQHSLALFSPRVFSWIRSTGGRTIVAVSEIDVAAVTAESGFLTGMLSLFSIGVALALAGALSRDLQRAARTVRTNVNRIAAGDLTPGETLESEDELGELARVVDGTRNALRRTIGDVASASDAVEHAAEDIKRASDRVARSTADQTSRIADVSQSTERVNVQMGGIAESAAALNSTVDESSSSIRELQALGRSLEENAAAASARADESSASSKQMAESVREVLENTTRLFERVSEGSRNAEELATTARDVRAHADQTGQLSSSVLATAERGRERVDRTIGGIEQIRDATETARQVIEGLGERTERIGGVLSVIDDLASDTNLLSLNAAIIAAQAGEHGRAFAVVADEVRALADRVLESTKEIEALIHGLQTEAQSAIAAIHRGAESVREGVDLSAGAGDSLAEITATAQASGERVEEIVAAVRSQSDAAAQVKEQMEQILIGIREIQAAGHEHSRGGEIVLANAQGVGEVAKRVQQSTEEQVENVSRIAETVQVVRRAAVAINNSLQEQSASMREVAAALEDMSARTRSNDESVRRFGDTASSLVAQAERVRRAIGRFQLD